MEHGEARSHGAAGDAHVEALGGQGALDSVGLVVEQLLHLGTLDLRSEPGVGSTPGLAQIF